MASKVQMTDTQRQLSNTLDKATMVVIAYAASEVPELGNQTPEGLLEEFGRLNEARKALEKTEKILKTRLVSQLGGKTSLRGDNYNVKIESSERTALNQTSAKAYFEEQGLLADYVDTTEVERTTVKRN